MARNDFHASASRGCRGRKWKSSSCLRYQCSLTIRCRSLDWKISLSYDWGLRFRHLANSKFMDGLGTSFFFLGGGAAVGDDLPRFESERVTFKVKSRVFEYSRGPAQSYFMLEPIKKSSLYFKEEDQRDINSYYHQKFKHESIYLTNLSICF